MRQTLRHPRLLAVAASLPLLLAAGAPPPSAPPPPQGDRFAVPATDAGLPGAGPIRRYDWFQ
jgi:hypothetical protein